MAEKITVEDLKNRKHEFMIIDVRELDELEAGKISDSTHMPLGLVIRNANKGEINNLKEKKICTYCRNGYRGNFAADELNKKGFNAVTLDGGFDTWNKK
ncbi:MAG: sulfurtransferase [Nitrosopumilales archaeon CG15_BIG_FIL_POST_REV_8_21_14_020_33_23]|nr:MAG: sulfurtransferase [Nitrosopumilales archaeon CG11_big_fil_rev_8_21_14_0_20_33_24]PIW34462.1 MAG: sulfurtransferase [Nitrosopumilales archaeon CG15_BIG_FIL_POST_REV_8_21_14_020_33_23]PIY88296.1 MAG: sulfurtransferase [Nitrosopumilales archaeon CG_4_10_14_0_8_um_filter_34_8]PJB98807.1 MAG: sulfurtransferase [Nitrosopumilales archaeon CG_4_9_14_0_8_um_filter_34_10]